MSARKRVGGTHLHNHMDQKIRKTMFRVLQVSQPNDKKKANVIQIFLKSICYFYFFFLPPSHIDNAN